ncbi:MAG: DUF1315 family protein [Alphaproteobacteria bacterium]|nr:DUF1315 family protein [Alphaproteobacteria bacterium]
MKFKDLATNLPLNIYLHFVKALKTGYWTDGSKLTDQQRLICANAVEQWQSAIQNTQKPIHSKSHCSYPC